MRNGIIRGITSYEVQATLDRRVSLIKLGWDSYSFLFYIGGVSAILGKFFGIAGWCSVVSTLGFFYVAGSLRKHIEKATPWGSR